MGPRKNEKAEAAKERKAAAKDEAGKQKAKAEEDAYWRAQGEGAKTKAQSKREEEEAKRAEAAARKAELKRLQEAEEAALSRPAKPAAKANRVSGPKVTHHQLSQQREADAEAREAEARERQLAARREVRRGAPRPPRRRAGGTGVFARARARPTRAASARGAQVTAESYSRLVEVENANRVDDAVDARSMEQAIDALGSLGVGAAESPAVDKHPEKRARAAWKAYEEHNLPLLRMEKPNLKASQYRDLLWKAWQKAPENPLVAAGRV
ncbi:coiled-coil domain-containing protein [Scenedesmus sp. PABB004]|nr:coiled-coil domain-containing protein [Scenedesmus sp. PABB004]